MRVVVAVHLGLMVFSACERRPTASPVPEDARRRYAAWDIDAPGVVFDPALRGWLETRLPLEAPAPALKRKARAGDCRAAYAPRPERDPNPMCKVSGGPFGFGDAAIATTVADFFIDQFEVSAAQVALFLNARGSNLCPGLDRRHPSVGPNECAGATGLSTSPLTLSDGVYSARPGFERVAVTYISFQGALEYCAWVGKLVPSSAQWEYAARHDPHTGRDLRYPWGDEWRPNHASCWQSPACKAPPRPPYGESWLGHFDGTAGRGDGSSPWGVHDMVGGATELVFACEDPNATCTLEAPCACTPQMVLNDMPSPEEMAPERRAVTHESGAQGLRCARPATE